MLLTDTLSLPTPRTIAMREILARIGWHKTLNNAGTTLFLVENNFLDGAVQAKTEAEKDRRNFMLSCRNLMPDGGIQVQAVEDTSVRDILRADRLVFEEGALRALSRYY